MTSASKGGGAAPRPLVLGVLNVTPDSFSDGGRHFGVDAGLEHARRLIADGADWLDVGGESTRPRAEPVSEADERQRVLPVIRAIRAESDVPISIDTRKPAVARAAVEAGAAMWNDVTALAAPGAADAAAELGCHVVLMHMQGVPETMQVDPRYDDVVGEVAAFLQARAEAALAAGVLQDRIWLDPGIGFGKRLEHNLALIAALPRLVALGFPIVLGVSRKQFVKYLDPRAEDPHARLGGGLAAALHGARAGVAMVRAHDVFETVQALKVQAAIKAAEGA